MPKMVRRPDVKPDMIPAMVWMPGDGHVEFPAPTIVQRPDVIETTENECPSCRSPYNGDITRNLERVRWYVYRARFFWYRQKVHS